MMMPATAGAISEAGAMAPAIAPLGRRMGGGLGREGTGRYAMLSGISRLSSQPISSRSMSLRFFSRCKCN
jgi:hypothetical protein